jgi:hypothetical protein
VNAIDSKIDGIRAVRILKSRFDRRSVRRD